MEPDATVAGAGQYAAMAPHEGFTHTPLVPDPVQVADALPANT